MRRFFFYGTLLDHDVMALVIGRRLPPAAFTPAVLAGHARRRAKGMTYPVVVPSPAESVLGAVVGGLAARDVARLAAYEGPGYRIARLKVRIAGALETVSVFEPVAMRLQPSASAWDYALWKGRHKRPFVARLRKALSGRSAYSRP
ncbi:gamma-glutamylcyclotransferase family protein [Reyranella sp.]|uniref:gamma-glutamylcyclotransferase family protein n=1 Tax=Reyranella sp. TaxID=1929291 RepID=UPI003BAB2A34